MQFFKHKNGVKVQALTLDTYTLNPSILREYDIRGIVGETLFTDDAYYIGKAFGTLIRRQGGNTQVCVGFDGRLSSPEIEESLVKGLISVGIEVIRIGLAPSPMLYYASRALNTAGGIIVTGSHNPPTHNGFKFVQGKASLYGGGIKQLGDMIASNDFVSGKGSVSYEDVSQPYIEALLQGLGKTPSTKNLSIAWDPGNGAAGDAVVSLCKRLPGKHVLINTDIDGTFPAHHPDPTVPENLEELIATVKKHNCDFGIAFDGDGDRIGAIDSEGRIIWGDQLMVLFAHDVLKTHPGATIMADVKASQVLFDEIAKAGGTPLMWKTGHSLIKAKMLETGALLAGEMSGHIFFADEYFGFDDALYAAIRLLRIAAHSDKTVAEMLDSLPSTHNTPEIRIECDESRKFAIIDEAKARLANKGAELNDVDGMRVLTEDGWWLLRASNTQAALVVRCESSTPEGLERLKASVGHQLEQSGVSLPE